MKRILSVQAIVLICIVFNLPALSVAEENRREGHWWREQDRLTRLVFIVGFFDGMELGHHFSYWNLVKEKEMSACIGKVRESYEEYRSKYFESVTSVQLVDGLDSFYADSRNRSIGLADALWLVLNGISGTPQQKLDTMIENWRRNSR